MVEEVVWVEELVPAVPGGEPVGDERRVENGVVADVASNSVKEVVVYVKALWSGWPVLSCGVEWICSEAGEAGIVGLLRRLFSDTMQGCAVTK